MTDKANILIVDDRPEKVLALEAVLEDLEQTIVRANSGRDALRYVLQQEFAVILLDVNMPGMDGFETAAMIRQRAQSMHVPIIFITAFSDEMHAARGYSLGAVDYIQAPVLPDVLRTKVAVFVDLFRKTQQLRAQAEQQRQRAMQLQKLAASSVVINSAMSIEQMLQTIADSARDVLGTHQAIMLYLGEPGITPPPKPIAIGSFSDRYRDWRGRPLELAPVAQTMVARSRTPTRMTEAELRAHLDWQIVSNLAIPPVTGGMLAAPLCGRDGGNLGVIYVTDSRKAPEFTSDDEAILVQLAQMGSIAIENTIYSQEREANRAKDEFLGTLSHELRTPLNAILGWTELMKYEQMGEEVSHAFEVIDRNARAQAKLIEDLLEVSRITSGKLQISPRPMDLSPVINAAIDAVRPSAEAKQVTLAMEIAPPLHDQKIPGDPDRLQQVVWNLLSNALKFTASGGRVTVSATCDDNSHTATICVRDNGQGIAAEFLPHVFERFRQADSSSTRRHGGLGIGLTIVRHIVELHGGAVSVQSEGAGHGACFSFTLPMTSIPTHSEAAAGAAPTQHSDRPVPERPQSLKAVRVLLVDDDADAREVLANVLRRHDADVITAESVAQAMERLEQSPIDLVISDISMPDEDGYSLIRRLQARAVSLRTAPMPAIALTAHARAGDRDRTLAAGYREHVAKPVKPSDLIAVMHHVLAGGAVAAVG